MRSTLRIQSIVLALAVMWGAANYSVAATITAANCSQSAVQTAINAAGDGDKVVIPNGACTWTGGISTSKQIRVEAQNYTPAPMGTMSRNVTITNNSTSTPLFSFTSGNNFHVGLAGIRLNEGSGNQNHVRFNGSGSKVPLVNDCAFEVKERNGNNPGIAAVAWLSQGGITWNSYFSGTGSTGSSGASILINSPRGWYTASTMGALDTSGTVNVYIEDSTLKNIGQAPDVDDNGRLVIRHSLLDGVSGLTHGFTSSMGGRHFEYYNNTIQVSTANRDVVGRYFWVRAGTGIFTDNTVTSTYNGYAAPNLLSIGDNTSPKPYPQPRQPGWGHDGATNVSDPIYIWNQTGNGAYKWGIQGGWDSNVKLNRDIFVNSGAKPGYSKYTYPHPLRSGGSGGSVNPLPAPSNLRIQ